jgi:hypothetical protein
MILYIYVLIFILIILNIYYILNIKYNCILDKKEDFKSYENNDILIKYSSININSVSVSDIYNFMLLLEIYDKIFYVQVIDAQIINDNDLMNVLNENIQETTIITNSKINNDVYVILYPNIDNDSNGLKLNKIVLIYPSYLKKNNKIIKNSKENIKKFNNYFVKDNFGGNTIIYKLNRDNKAFSLYLHQ